MAKNHWIFRIAAYILRMIISYSKFRWFVTRRDRLRYRIFSYEDDSHEIRCLVLRAVPSSREGAANLNSRKTRSIERGDQITTAFTSR